MFKNKKNIWAFSAVVALVVITALFAFRRASSASGSIETATVTKLELSETVSASGKLAAQPYTVLTWKTNGTVKEVNIQVGRKVKAGEILLSLEATSAPASVISAQADLVNAKLELENVLKSSLELAQAQQKAADAMQAVKDAQDNVTKLEYRRASDDLVQQTQDEIDLAKEKVSRAEDAYKRVKDRPEGDSLKAQASLNLVNARAERDDKIALLNWYLGKYDEIDAAQYRAALAVAEAQLADAQREVERLKDGPNADEVAAAQARVDAAQATVNSLFIIAPFDGEVLAVEHVAGEAVQTGSTAVYLADMNHLYVEAQVDESDIASVQVGQAAEVTLDALPGVTFTGQVTRINPVGESVSGLVKYNVRIDLQPASGQAFIPLGTTANLTILVQAARAALTVPITAIQNDAQGEFVLTIDNQRISVVTGAIVDDRVIISGNLQPGQSLLLNNTSSFEAPNPLSGGK